MHLHKTSVQVGDVVKLGQAIGAMGGRGPTKATQYAQHVHYHMKDPKGQRVDPKDYVQREDPKQASSTNP